MKSFWWFLAAAGSVVGGLVLLTGMAGAKSAPQEAAVAALAVASAVVPYVFARAMQLFSQESREQERHLELLAALRAARPTGDTAPAGAQVRDPQP